MIDSPFLVGRDRYERVVEGWIDNTHDDAFTHSVRISDDDHTVELSAVCTPSPGYEVREARARILAGAADPALVEELGRLAGARMVAGFTRRLGELCGARPGATLFVGAGIEIARLARQTTKLPREAIAGVRRGDALACWTLDTTGWVDLPNSCFTYSAAGRALLDARAVSTPMTPELYSPAPGARKIFVRKKVSRLVLTDDRLHLFHSMHDNVHGFDIHYEVDLGSGTIVAADSITSRLPYSTICREPQKRISEMIGQSVDTLLRKRTQSLLGGEAGCAQLYDLTADLLRLINLDR
ncbi:MAG TPA: DUF2889 domain-containing protein [Methylomirabilota bacterium]|jgi:hypothetical protein|nr:DUF2889 domain-containing protein [Methylomirabilota bacterium]